MSLLSTLITAGLTLIHVPKPFAAILEPILEKSGQNLIADATVAAQPIVATLESGTLPNEQKLRTATDSLVAHFKAEGKALSAQSAHTAIELALACVRSKI